MKKIVIIGLTLILGLGLLAVAVMAQAPGFGRGFGMGPGYGPPGAPLSPVQPKSACRMVPFITFTEEQAMRLANLRRAYIEEAKPLWSELRDLRLELRFAVSDPRVQPEGPLDKQRKISVLQAKLETLFFSYQIKARSFFTKEQLDRFPSDCPLKTGAGFPPGGGKGKGARR